MERNDAKIFPPKSKKFNLLVVQKYSYGSYQISSGRQLCRLHSFPYIDIYLLLSKAVVRKGNLSAGHLLAVSMDHYQVACQCGGYLGPAERDEISSDQHQESLPGLTHPPLDLISNYVIGLHINIETLL